MDHDAHFSETVLKQDSMTFLPLGLLPFPPALWKSGKQRTCVMAFSTITDNHSWRVRVY